MAPSRKKSASRAAAAAVPQWKVGDLVLAKVKGYPPWPATVSEPEKWGYSADWKKVLVYFFGTQQIAFCNPADVEAFTEEKKRSLLVKPQGKGADFVRAVREIIDSYEKLKKESQDDVSDPGADVIRAHSADTSLNFGSKNQKEANEGSLGLQTKSADDTQAAIQKDILTNKESTMEKASESDNDDDDVEIEKRSNTTNAETTSPATSRRKTVDTGSRMTLQIEPIRTSRSLSMVQNVSTCQDVRDGRKRKSPESSSCQDVGVAALCSNASVADNCSKIMTVDSDTNGLKKCSAIDSKCEVEHLETLECLEGDVQLNKRLGVQTKAIVIKKKRKTSRKRVANAAAKSAVLLDKEAIVEVSVPNTIQSGNTSCGKIGETYSKEDGEKHLPLLKRARVRMGKSSCDEDLNDLSNAEDRRWKEKKTKQSQQTSLIFEDMDSIDGNPSALNGTVDTLPPGRGSVLNRASPPNISVLNTAVDISSSTLMSSTPIRESGSLQCKLKKDLMVNCSVDGEADLPPSKRLHRALEAMSANAVEEIQLGNKLSPTKESSTGCCISSRKCLYMPRDSIANNNLGLKEMGSASRICLTGSSNNSNLTSLEVAVRSSEEACVNSQAVDNVVSQNHEGSDNVLPVVTDQWGRKDTITSMNSTVFYDPISTKGDTSPSPKVMWSKGGFQQDSSSSSLAQNGEGNTSVENLDKASDTYLSMETSIDGLSGSSSTGKASPQITNCVSHKSKDVTPSENGDSLKPPLGSTQGDNHMSAIVKGVESNILEDCEKSLPNPHVGDKTGIGMRLNVSSTNTEFGDGLAEGSSPNASGCNVSTSDSSNNILQSNGCSSPDIHLNSKKSVGSSVSLGTKLDMEALQRSRSAGKSAEGQHTALVSFEAIVVTLTRTKESIGRATRIAIDCAKSGIANKVVEILVRTLETESSLHRRIDLFFLVDSITQCSRGLKGDAAVYPSAIQSVLPRLLSAAAPHGRIAQENRRQCLKVLRLWLERKILPESIVRQHMQEIDCYGGSASAGAYSRRSLRTERALDDPVREMEGMLVDEYGSNSSFQLPGFCMPRMLKDEHEGSDSDGGSFEAVTPEHDRSMHEDEMNPVIVKHRHILEDVDGELEMEDVAPSCDIDMNSLDIGGGSNFAQAPYNQFEKNIAPHFAPPLPCVVPPSSLPLPPSPPPPSPPSVNLLPSTPDAYSNDSKANMETQLAATRNNQANIDSPHYRGPECREPPSQRLESSSAYGSFHVPPRDQHSSGPVHNKPYTLRPPHHLPSNQFSFIHGDHHVKPCREAAPNYSHRHHYEQNFERESYYNNHDRENYYYNHDRKNYYNNHDRMRPPRYEYRDNWRVPAPYSGQRYYDKGMPTPYGCHPREPSKLPGHGWRFPPRSMNHRNPLPYESPYEGTVPVGSRGQGYWRPR